MRKHYVVCREHPCAVFHAVLTAQLQMPFGSTRNPGMTHCCPNPAPWQMAPEAQLHPAGLAFSTKQTRTHVQ